jgi:hypothetical protein
VAGLIKGLKTKLMSADELTKIVEPSGLFTDAQLTAAYRHAALTHRYVIEDLSGPAYHFNDTQAHGKIRWSLDVKRTNAIGGYEVCFRIRPDVEGARGLSDNLSAEGVAIKIYSHRRRVKSFCADATTVVTVPGTLRVPFTAQPWSDRVTILVRVPPTAFSTPGRE